MKRILLIGAGGAGKSTLARRLAARTGLPEQRIQVHERQAGWRETPKAAWRQTVATLVQREAWIMDGNFGGTLDLRLAACDTVLFLDLPPLVCAWRILRRRLQYRGAARPDMAPGCPEHLDLCFLAWILGYRWRHRPGILRRLAVAAAGGRRVEVLASAREVEAFLANVPATAPVQPQSPARTPA